MEQLPRLQAQIASLQELRDLVRAMRALAASHVQEAHGALEGIRRYVGVVEDAIAEGAALLPETDGRAVGEATEVAAVLIVVGSEHGFTGAYNETLLARAAAERKEGQDLIVLGRRAALLAAEKGLDVHRSFAMATHVGGVLGVTRRVAEYLTAVTAADMVYVSHRKGGDFEPEAQSILPIDPALLVGAERRSPPLHHLPAQRLLQRLAGEYLFAEITRAVMESLVSENAARLRVMQSADYNIGDKLEALGRREDVLRQEAITAELLDVAIGAEAILGAVPKPGRPAQPA